MNRSGTRVAIVVQHELVRMGLRAALDGRLLVNVVGEASTAAEGVALCRTAQPDVVVTGLPLRGATGCDHIAAFRRASPRTAVVVVTGVVDPDTVVQAVRAGAAGYAMDDRPCSDLLDVIDRAVAGESYVDPRVVSSVIRSIGATSGQAPPAAPPPLTPRELEVLRQVAAGSANKEIARDLRLAAGTVKVHVEHILAKLGAVNRADASIRAMRLGLLDPEPLDHAMRTPTADPAPGDAPAA